MGANETLKGPALTQYAKEHVDSDPKAILELVLAETQRVRTEAERELAEQKAMADVDFGANGLAPRNLAGLWRMAVMYSKTQMVPTHFRDRPYDCAIVIEMAIRCKQVPMTFLQKCYVVHGRPSIESTLAIALANTSGIIRGRITYSFTGEGDTRECKAMATLADTGELITQTVSIKIARSMGWWGKADSLWPKMPELMLQYRSAMWLIRAYFPEVLMGVYSTDETRDMTGGRLPGEIGDGMFDGLANLPTNEAVPSFTEPAAPAPSKSDKLADKLADKKKPAKAAKEAEKPFEPEPVHQVAEEAEAAWSPPGEPELEPAQEAVEEEQTQPVVALTVEEQTDLISDWMKKIRAATDCDEVDAELHFGITSQVDKFRPEQVKWCKDQAEKKKTQLLANEKPGKKPSQKSMLGGH